MSSDNRERKRAVLVCTCSGACPSMDSVNEPDVADVEVEAADAAVCGPDCSCVVPSRSRRVKVVIGVIALLAVAGILVYKASVGGPSKAASSAVSTEPGFVAGSVAGNGALESPATSQGVIESETDAAASAPAEPTGEGGDRAKVPVKGETQLGENLESFNDLNSVAMDVDAVFIFVPAENDEGVSTSTRKAVLAAQKTLVSRGIKMGLFALRSSSPDFSAVAAQVQLPAILVSFKGGGMGSVTGEVTETKLLQAFVAASSAGGCGPSGCGPSGCN